MKVKNHRLGNASLLPAPLPFGDDMNICDIGWSAHQIIYDCLVLWFLSRAPAGVKSHV